MDNSIYISHHPSSITEGDIDPEKPSVHGVNKKIIKTEYINGTPVSERITEWGYNDKREWVVLRDVERPIEIPEMPDLSNYL